MKNIGNLLVIIGCAILLGLFLIVVLALARVKETSQWSNYKPGISNLSIKGTSHINGGEVVDIVTSSEQGGGPESFTAIITFEGKSGNIHRYATPGIE